VHQHLVVNPTGDRHAGVRRGPHIHLGALVGQASRCPTPNRDWASAGTRNPAYSYNNRGTRLML
jgi:hypothetical protein